MSRSHHNSHPSDTKLAQAVKQEFKRKSRADKRIKLIDIVSGKEDVHFKKIYEASNYWNWD